MVGEEAAQAASRKAPPSPHPSPSPLCTSWPTWQSRNPGRKKKVLRRLFDFCSSVLVQCHRTSSFLFVLYTFKMHVYAYCPLFSPPRGIFLTENKETVPLGKSVKEEKEGDSLEVLHQCKTTSLANSIEQGSTLRDLLTTTAGKLKLGSTDAGIAFAPVYSTASQVRGAGMFMMSRCATFEVFPVHSFICGGPAQIN